MDCHVIFLSISSCSFVQKGILYVGFLDLNRGSHTSLMLAMTLVGTKDNCTWNTHMPWKHCNCLWICITIHQRQVSNTWFPTHEVALRKQLQRTAAIFHCDSCCTCQTACQAEWKYGCLLGKDMMSACVEIILCLLFPVTVVRLSMNHKEKKRVIGNKIQQANVQKYFMWNMAGCLKNARCVSKWFACENLKFWAQPLHELASLDVAFRSMTVMNCSTKACMACIAQIWWFALWWTFEFEHFCFSWWIFLNYLNFQVHFFREAHLQQGCRERLGSLVNRVGGPEILIWAKA